MPRTGDIFHTKRRNVLLDEMYEGGVGYRRSCHLLPAIACCHYSVTVVWCCCRCLPTTALLYCRYPWLDGAEMCGRGLLGNEMSSNHEFRPWYHQFHLSLSLAMSLLFLTYVYRVITLPGGGPFDVNGLSLGSMGWGGIDGME